MSEEQKPFSEEYVGGNQATTTVVTPETGTMSLQSEAGTISVQSANVGTESISTTTPYGLAKPRRVVIRAKVLHEPQS